MEYLVYWIPVIISLLFLLSYHIYIMSKKLKSIPYEYQVGDEISVLVDLYDIYKYKWVEDSTTAKLLGISPDRKTVIIEYNNGRRYDFVEEIKCYNVLANYSLNKRIVDEEIAMLKNKKDIWNEI